MISAVCVTHFVDFRATTSNHDVKHVTRRRLERALTDVTIRHLGDVFGNALERDHTSVVATAVGWWLIEEHRRRDAHVRHWQVDGATGP